MNFSSECEKDMTPEEIKNTDNTDTADAKQSQSEPETQVLQSEPESQNTDNISPDAECGQKEKCSCEKEEKPSEKEKHSGEKEKRKLESEIRQLSGEIEKLNAALDEEKGRYIRLYAEYENYRKRTAAEKQAVYIDAYADALKEMLPVYDALERALNMASGTTDPAKMLEGIKLTFDMFNGALGKMGIERFGAPGDKFDPVLHNAVMHEESDERGEGEITEVFQPGFKKGDRVLRFAMVKVAN